MKTKPKFNQGQYVCCKTNLGARLEVISIQDKGKYYQYSCIDLRGVTTNIHQTMLIEWVK